MSQETMLVNTNGLRTLCGLCFMASLACFISACEPSRSTNEGESDSLADLASKADDSLAPLPIGMDLPLATLKESGAAFDETLLNSLGRVDDYLLSEDKAAMDLGVYATEALYLALYEKTQEYIMYSTTCQRMANEIGIREGFDAETVQRLDGNVGNPDSVCAILNEAILKAKRSLEADGQHRSATMIAIGSFMENLHLLSAAIKNYPTDTFPGEDQRLKAMIPTLRAILKQKNSIKPIRERLAVLEKDQTVTWLTNTLDRLETALVKVKANPALPNDGLTAKSLDDLIPLVEEIRANIVK